MILDTNAISALLAGERSLERLLETAERHQLPVIVLGEYHYGLMRSRFRKSLQLLFDRLVAESEVLPIDMETAAVYAEARTELHRRGNPIPQNDLWIAALCLQHGATLVSSDSHFDVLPEVDRVSW